MFSREMLLVYLLILGISVLAQRGEASDAHSDSAVKKSLSYGKGTFDWINSMPGGFVSDKIEVRALFPDDPTSPLGIYAVEDLEKDEILSAIPHDALITSGGSDDACDVARNIVEEYKKGDDSDFAIYVQYLMANRPRGLLPSSWSDKGIDLFKLLIGKEQPPEDVDEYSFDEECDGPADPDLEHAFMTVVQRRWDDKMIPILDLVNHRNGKWFNTDSTPVHDEKTDKIIMHTIREVKAGEQLYLSYSHCIDCAGYEETFLTPHIIPDFAFIEEFPQRWGFNFFEDPFYFQIDEKSDGSGELEITWPIIPDLSQMNYLRGQYKRMKNLNETMLTTLDKLESPHEKWLIKQYYDDLTTALALAIKEPVEEDLPVDRVDTLEMCVEPDGSSNLCSAQRNYDLLTEDPRVGGSPPTPICEGDHGISIIEATHDTLDQFQGGYQLLEYTYNEDARDPCLFISDGHEELLHVCASLRPHYHEAFVHFPARYLDSVKRVAFVGGGDSMLLHEILKYPSVELVLGLELDQAIVRKSFQHFGTTPEWHNEKVEWWFGDAAKSLLMIPSDYYGSFDLVIVDLITDVINVLMVTEDLNIMDAALLLLNKDGMLITNDDYGTLIKELPTKHKIQLKFKDFPLWCVQTFTMGSPTVDFFSKAPKDQDVNTLILEDLTDANDSFATWSNYIADPEFEDYLCKDPGLIAEFTPGSPQHGVMMIINAENTTILIDSPAKLQNSISEALVKVGVKELRVVSDGLTGSHSLIFILEEGYVVARLSPSHAFCAFDVFMWSGFDKQEATKYELVKVVGSEKSFSSYRIVIGGTSGLPGSAKVENVGPRLTRDCVDDPVEPKSCERDTAALKFADVVLSESLSLIQVEDPVVVVLCSAPCPSRDFLASENPSVKFVQVEVCPVLSELNSTSPHSGSAPLMISCEVETLRRVEEFVEKNGKIDGIVITNDVPKAMGQVLHKILAHKPTRLNVLSESYIVTILSELGEGPISGWQFGLLQQFQKKFEKFDPAYTAKISLRGKDGDLGMGLFSCGDIHFLLHLTSLKNRLEQKTSFSFTVDLATSGYPNYVADFEPSKEFSLDDHYDDSTLQHWKSQKALGLQTVFQLVSSGGITPQQLKRAFQKSLFAMPVNGIEDARVEVWDDLGDGQLASAIWQEGSAVLLWGGNDEVHVNFYTSNQDRKYHARFLSSLRREIPTLKHRVYDEQPRGIGRIVSFPEDLNKLPVWAS